MSNEGNSQAEPRASWLGALKVTLYNHAIDAAISLRLLADRISFLVLGVGAGIVSLSIFERDPNLGAYILASIGGVVGLKLYHRFNLGDVLLGKVFKLAMVLAVGIWFHFFLGLASHSVFDPYHRPSMDEYLISTWGPAWGKPLEEVKQDEEIMRKMRRDIQTWHSRLNEFEKTRSDVIHSDQYSDFTRSAAYANFYLSRICDSFGHKTKDKLGWDKWVYTPTTRGDKIIPIFALHSPSMFRLRILGHFSLLCLLGGALVVMRFVPIHPDSRFKFGTLAERIASYEGAIRVVFLAACMVFASLVVNLFVFVSGPSEVIYPFVAPVPFVLVVWFSLLSRE